jgi:hypothetical protein
MSVKHGVTIMVAWRSRRGFALIVLLFQTLAACGHMPVTSMVKLARVDFQTTDPEKLRVAVRLPNALRARAEGTVLRLAVRVGKGAEESRDFALREITDRAELETLAGEGDAGFHLSAFAIAANDVAHVRMFRAALLQKKRDGVGGSLSISVRPETCRTEALPNGPVLFSTYLRTGETNGYVPLACDVDLRSVSAERDIAAMIPQCPT